MGGAPSRPRARQQQRSSPPPPPPKTVTTAEYPTLTGITNLSVSDARTCKVCAVSLDTSVTTSSVRLSRDIGSVKLSQCREYQRDLDGIGKTISFQDFFVKLQSGSYARELPKTVADQNSPLYCEEIMFSDEDAALINNKDDFERNKSKLQSIRIRKATGGGDYSIDTKAKYTFSIPINMKFDTRVVSSETATTQMQYNPVNRRWVPVPVKTTAPLTETRTVPVKSISIFHPCPVRVENVQFDAVMTLNDPADLNAGAIIMVPLRGVNTGSPSTDFFSRIVKQVISISTPDAVTGTYQGTEIPTGKDWNVTNVFTMLEPKQGDDTKFQTIANAYFTWEGSAQYERAKIKETSTAITYGWVPTGSVRFFMLQHPVDISLTDLSTLTRNLPATPPEEAIPVIPRGASFDPKPVLYKKSEGAAIQKECGISSRESFVGGVREHMETMDVLDSLWDSGGDLVALRGEDGTLVGEVFDKCDPFAVNAQNARTKRFSPADAVSFLLNFLILISLAVGVWVALWSVTKYYDDSYANFATTAGKVLGTIALRSTGGLKSAAKAELNEEASKKREEEVKGFRALLDAGDWRGKTLSPEQQRRFRDWWRSLGGTPAQYRD